MSDRLISADKLKAHYAWWKGGSREMTMDEAKSDFDTIVDLQPTVEAEPIKQTIEKFRDYQIEWLTAHNDIEFCEEEENLIVRFLKDTAEYAIKFGIDEVENG